MRVRTQKRKSTSSGHATGDERTDVEKPIVMAATKGDGAPDDEHMGEAQAGSQEEAGKQVQDLGKRKAKPSPA